MILNDHRKHKIKEETHCAECIHNKVCSQRTESFCKNYIFGTSEGTNCQSCLNRYTRWGPKDEERLPCFLCKYFRKD